MPDDPTGAAQPADTQPPDPEQELPAPEQDLPALIKTATSQARLRTFRLGLTVGVLLAAALALLIVQNGDSVELNWLTFDFEAPLWLLLLASAIAGGALQWLAATLWRRARADNTRRRLAAQQLGDLVGGPDDGTPGSA